MFQKKTVIVVGAGASSEANLPVGGELTSRIAGLLDIPLAGARQRHGDTLIHDAIRHAAQRDDPSVGDIEAWLRACWRIRDAMPQAMSIDSFIDAHRGDESLELCGKLAIARAILQEEKKSLLFFDSTDTPITEMLGRLRATWFNAFMQLLSENCRVDGLAKRLESICLIVFNYDRCIEHFLVNAIQNFYGIGPDQAEELVRSIEVHHPSGTVGALPWYGREPGIAFGAEPTASQLVDLAGQIKTFAEGTDPGSSDIEKTRARVAEAEIVLFLGFAYHRQNLELLSPDAPRTREERMARCFGTAWHISTSDCDLIAHELAEILGMTMSRLALRPDLTCAKLFQEYWRSLSLS